MPGPRQLNKEDIMFIAGETETIYQHIGVLGLLDGSSRPEFDFSHFRQQWVDRISMLPHFHWKLHTVPMGVDRPYWVEDEHFNFDHHIKRIALPGPGDHITLCEVAANLYSHHLDHSKPLWEIWFIEGLEGGKCAFLYQFHHCMMDGGGALQLIEFLCDSEPDPSEPKEVDETVRNARPGEIPSYQEKSVRAWQHMAEIPLNAAKSAYRLLGSVVQEQIKHPGRMRGSRPQVPSTRFNGEISSERAFAFASLPLEDMKSVKNHFDVSLNDVLLALVSGAVRRYLLEQSELPDLPLRASIPVSIRQESDDQMSNKVTSTTMTLATDLDDPAARLKEINRDAKEAKMRAHKGGTGMLEVFQIMPPLLVGAMMESMPTDYAAQIMGANLFVSNTRSSPETLYMSGATIDNMFPMSIVTGGMGINVTCVSYNGRMDIGIIVDPELVPDHGELTAGLESSLAEYLTLCKPAKAGRRKKRPARARSKMSAGKI